MTRRTLQCGIMPKEDFIQRTIAIAKGEYKPSPDEPKVWFESPLSMAKVLSRENMELLKVIVTQKPKSIAALAELSGRAKSNLSRTLKTMSRYGIVQLKKQGGTVVPIVMATDFNCRFGLGSYWPNIGDDKRDHAEHADQT